MTLRLGRTRSLGCLLGALILCSASQSSLGQAVTTTFTYQGVLRNNNAPLNGTVDLRFTLWDAASGGAQVGAAVPVNALSLADGLITTTLDFGVSAFGGTQRWLQIEVDSTPGGGAGPFQVLTPRQPLTAVPYAMFALAGSGQWTPSGSNINYTQGNVAVGNANITGQLGTAKVGIETTDQYYGLLVKSSFIGSPFFATALRAEGPQTAGQFLTTGTNGRGITVNSTSFSGTSHGIDIIMNSPDAVAIEASSGGFAGRFLGDVYVSDYVGFGRSTPTNSSTSFDVYDASASGYGGMYVGTANTSAQPFYGYATGGTARAWTEFNGAANQWRLALGAVRMVVDHPTGFVGINTLLPKGRLHVNGDYYGLGHLWLHAYQGDGVSGTAFIQARDTSTTSSIDLQLRTKAGNSLVDAMILKSDGKVGIGTTAPTETLHVNGTTSTNVLKITGGADLSEQFEINASGIAPEPGMVVVIDSANPGQLVPATTAYDKRVAGVISGAGGVKTGMMMSQTGSIADGEHAVALTGRVYCLVDAGDAAIEPGDLLTTSATAGHAMKAVDHDRANGAIIGKAMTALPRGEKGLVLVLVNLQ